MTSSCGHEPLFDTHPEEVINRAKFKISTHGSFRGIKTDTQRDRIALYILDTSRLRRRHPAGLPSSYVGLVTLVLLALTTLCF